ncbi:TetR family transcriptional regulator [Rhizobium cremeum]|uniref:TetR/AcrR family transcriptional regulator n=1 Tax=Rhizobium cremeum TaxID=2813827 RepID=UPI000DDDB1F7
MKEPRRRGRPPLGQEPKAATIVEKATFAFARHGYDGTSLRLIAEAADVDVAYVGRLYGSKHGLWKAAIDGVAEDLCERMRHLPEPDAEDALPKAIAVLTDLLCDRPELAMFMLKEFADRDERFEYAFEKIGTRMRGLFVARIRVAQARGQAHAGDPDFLFYAFTSAMAMTAATRPYLARFTETARDDDSYRAELHRTLSNMLLR